MTQHRTTQPAPRPTLVITYTDIPPGLSIRIEVTTKE